MSSKKVQQMQPVNYNLGVILKAKMFRLGWDKCEVHKNL